MTKQVKTITLTLSIILLNISIVFSQTHKQNRFQTPFQGTKYYCTTDNNQTFEVTIIKNKIIIKIPSYKDYKGDKFIGTIKNGIILTNDSNEVAYRKSAGKYKYGKYYKVDNENFGQLNGENGDYFWYTACSLQEKLVHDKKD